MTMHLPAVAQGQNATSEPNWKRIVFTERKVLNTLVKMCPILKDSVDKTQRDYDSLPSSMRTQPHRVQIAVARNEGNNVSLFS